MASVRQTREREVVRRFLEHLANTGTRSKTGQKTIEDLAEEVDIAPEDLRKFRDGNNESLDKTFITAYAKLLGRGDVNYTGYEIDDSLGFADPSTGGWYGAWIAEEYQRQARLRMFQLIDNTRPEASSACDAWADLGVTGNISGDARYAGGFEPICHPSSTQGLVNTMDAVSQNINQNVFPDDEKWKAFRGIAKYGSQFGEIGLGMQGGRNYIEGIRPLHCRTIMAHRSPDGLYDPAKAWKQVMPGRSYADPNAYFAEWQIMHLRNATGWGDVYGRSIFDPCLRSYVQVESMEAAMIIRRLERASLRLKHIIDVGMIDGGDLAVNKYIDAYRNRNKKIRTIDNQRNHRMQKISHPSEEDVMVPKRDANSPADVSVLAGDASIGEITDFSHFFNKMLAGFGPPKAHLGYESDTMRSVITDLHIVFARKVRRMQLHFIAGLQQLYYLSLIFKGIDPRKARYTIFPPSLATRDELLRAQVQLAHATTCQYLAQAFSLTGKVPSIQWMLKYVMGMDMEAIDALDLKDVIQPSGGGAGFKNDPPKGDPKENQMMAWAAMSSPDVQEQSEHLRFMFEERAMALRLPSAATWLEKHTMSRPFDGKLERILPLLGITELRVA
jgi:hypothetical protein